MVGHQNAGVGDVAHHIVQRLVVAEAAMATAGQQRHLCAGVLVTLDAHKTNGDIGLLGWVHATRYACSNLEAKLFSQAGPACTWQALTSHAQ